MHATHARGFSRTKDWRTWVHDLVSARNLEKPRK
jgi:hypothetical protein